MSFSKAEISGYDFECDFCQFAAMYEGVIFQDSWEQAKADGWRSFKDKDGVWVHKCPACMEEA